MVNVEPCLQLIQPLMRVEISLWGVTLGRRRLKSEMSSCCLTCKNPLIFAMMRHGAGFGVTIHWMGMVGGSSQAEKSLEVVKGKMIIVYGPFRGQLDLVG